MHDIVKSQRKVANSSIKSYVILQRLGASVRPLEKTPVEVAWVSMDSSVILVTVLSDLCTRNRMIIHEGPVNLLLDGYSA